MKAIDHLVGWCVLFVVVCWAVTDAVDGLGANASVFDFFSAACGLVCGALAGISVWRDRLR